MTLWKDRDAWATSIRGSAFALQAKGCGFEYHVCPPIYRFLVQLVRMPALQAGDPKFES